MMVLPSSSGCSAYAAATCPSSSATSFSPSAARPMASLLIAIMSCTEVAQATSG